MRGIKCNNKNPTPYLRKHFEKLNIDKNSVILDLGCGNLRNSNYIKRLGFERIIKFDKYPIDDSIIGIDPELIEWGD